MIEIALKPGGDDSGQTRLGWIQTTSHIVVENINFQRSHVRIDGVVYTEDSEEFRKVFEKAKLWMTLQD